MTTGKRKGDRVERASWAERQHKSDPQHRLLRELLGRLRELGGWSQRKLAERMGVDHKVVARSESGARLVNLFQFFDWCRACNSEEYTVGVEEMVVHLLRVVGLDVPEALHPHRYNTPPKARERDDADAAGESLQ